MVCIDHIPGKYNCNECPYEIDGNYCEINMAKDALALLKDQEEEIENLKQMGQSMIEGICLLKEREAAEPEWRNGTPFCGNCGHRLEKRCSFPVDGQKRR